MTQLSAHEWETYLDRYPDCHLLQTKSWGDLKAKFGWKARWIGCDQAGAQVLFRRLPLGLSLAYIPRGPVGEDWSDLWPEVDEMCRIEGAFLLRVEPDCWEPVNDGFISSKLPGFQPGLQTIQPPRTILVDLSGSEDEILGRMKQKTRYNIHLAGKKGVVVHPSGDTGFFYQMMIQTGERDGFGIHSQEYYNQAYQLFHRHGDCELLLADYQGQSLAGLLVFKQGQRAWYLYGASNEIERSRMPAYLLQWEAMRWAKSQGCTQYDLWGIPDEVEEILEANFSGQSVGLWGVYRFKRGFGGQMKRTIGSWDKVYRPAAYLLYRFWLKIRRTPVE